MTKELTKKCVPLLFVFLAGCTLVVDRILEETTEPPDVECQGQSDGDPCYPPDTTMWHICVGGSCELSVCNDGFVDARLDENCDDGDQNIANGCTPECEFSCTTAADCDNGNDCDGAESCIEQCSMSGCTGWVCVYQHPAPPEGIECTDPGTGRPGSCVGLQCITE